MMHLSNILPQEFRQGQKVMTPKGEGTVVYQRMKPPDYIYPAAVSVRINGLSTIFPVEQVQAIPE